MQFLVIAAVGLVFLATASFLERSRGGALAERRFWMRLGVSVVLCVGLYAAGLLFLPERFHRQMGGATTVLSYALAWALYCRDRGREANKPDRGQP